ncbi:MAG: thiamine pyrophosphate-dependent enzyme [Candidatus Thermoplasmatota archaeon]
MAEDLGTYAENTWCPGCGNFGILNAMKKAVEKLEERDIGREKMLISAGIGCHAKIYDYLNLSGLYSIHGREIATIEGMKLANPELKVIGFGGDGDAYGEGLSHLIFAAKRNNDITMIVHNNSSYSLTTGQMSPTSEKGYKGPSTPEGSIEEPLNPLKLILSSGASFVSRGYAGDIQHLTNLIVEAVEHEGFSLVDVLQPCVVFHDDQYGKYNEAVEVLEETAETRYEAMELTDKTEKLPIGVFFKEDQPVYHEELYPDKNVVKDKIDQDEREKRVKKILEERA